VLVVFVVYQQLETHVLQPVVMSRTVERSALTVLVSILIGVELPGLLGALLAIPVAGVLQVIFRHVYDGSRGLKPDPTTGTGEIPVSQPRPLEPAEQQPHDAPPPSTGRPDRASGVAHHRAVPPGGFGGIIPVIQTGHIYLGEDGTSMGTDDKARNKAEELKGQAKEGLGRATDDEELEAEGRTDQAKSDVKQAGEKVKDAFKR
jgi:uncharacterized protein YjbJ (UPF0337 family)